MQPKDDPETSSAGEDERPRVLVVVVAYNSSATLDACVGSVLRDSSVVELIVVDNSSDPESSRIVEARRVVDVRIRYLDPGTNTGFARACNLGVAAAEANWSHVFFVNPDVELAERLDLLALSGPKPLGIVAARLYSPDHPSSANIRPIATRLRELAKAIVGTRAYRVDLAGDKPVICAAQVDGALLGMNKSTYLELGGFDERFELYYEDVDICRRANLAGVCHFVTKIWGTHVGGASSGSTRGAAYTMSRISRVRYLRKFYGDGVGTTGIAGLIAVVEFVSRSITRQAEGPEIRRRALRLQSQELRHPGTVRILQ